MKFKKPILFCVPLLILSSCNSNQSPYEKTSILCVMSGYEGESSFHNDIYRELITTHKNNYYNVDLNLYDLGNEKSSYSSTFKEIIMQKNYDYIVIFGNDLDFYLNDTIDIYQGIKFLRFDNENDKKTFNSKSYNFSPEQFGALAAKKIEEKNDEKIGYFYQYQDSFYNRKLYGLLSTLTKNNIQIFPYNLEERNNKEKVETYLERSKLNYDCSLFFEDIRDNLEYFYSKVNSSDTIFSTYFSQIKNEKSYIYKDYNKMFELMLSEIAKKEVNIESNTEVGIEGGYLSANDVETSSLFVNKYTEEKKDELKALKEKYFFDLASDYDTKDSVYGKFHEAVPHCDDINDWKYAPRPGGDNGRKPKDWKALGIWATIYAQDGKVRCNNTGIEFKNMKIYGYSSRRGRIFIEHANPVGAFYDENFVNDYHTNFEGKYFNSKLDKSTKILLDRETNGFNYHPFGEQSDLEQLDMVDIEYVYSTMDIRLIQWDKNQPSDMEDAKYVANIGGDRWVYKGATWKPDRSANKDVSVGQFRTITEDWKTLEMCSVPLELADQILGSKEFLQ